MDEEFLIFYLLLIHHFLITLKYKMIKVLLVLVFIHLSCCLTSSVWAFYPSNKYISTGIILIMQARTCLTHQCHITISAPLLP